MSKSTTSPASAASRLRWSAVSGNHWSSCKRYLVFQVKRFSEYERKAFWNVLHYEEPVLDFQARGESQQIGKAATYQDARRIAQAHADDDQESLQRYRNQAEATIGPFRSPQQSTDDSEADEAQSRIGFAVDDTAPPAPDFTDEQLAWLWAHLRVGCCHVSGTHDPTHFTMHRHVCDIQKSKAWKAIVEALGFDDLNDPDSARHQPDKCGWCRDIVAAIDDGIEILHFSEPWGDSGTIRHDWWWRSRAVDDAGRSMYTSSKFYGSDCEEVRDKMLAELDAMRIPHESERHTSDACAVEQETASSSKAT